MFLIWKNYHEWSCSKTSTKFAPSGSIRKNWNDTEKISMVPAVRMTIMIREECLLRDNYVFATHYLRSIVMAENARTYRAALALSIIPILSILRPCGHNWIILVFYNVTALIRTCEQCRPLRRLQQMASKDDMSHLVRLHSVSSDEGRVLGNKLLYTPD